MTTYEVVGNANYAAVVVEVKNLVDLPGLDNLVGVSVFGFTALVPRSTQVGDVLVVFPAETQLSDTLASKLNLYRHAEKNADPTKVGYLEDNRRIRAIRLRGNVSSALALPVSDLLVMEPGSLPKVGTSFDTINGVQISQKYVVPTTSRPSTNQAPKKREADVVFPVHFDTENYFRNADKIGQDTLVTVTQKVHGTSVRFGRVPASRPPRWRERIAKLLGVRVQTSDIAWVVGSRKATKTVDGTTNADASHWYADGDIWSSSVDQYRDSIPDGVLVYGELVGYTANGAEIQKNYTYNARPGETRLYVYRVSMLNERGVQFDLSWPGVVAFCAERGMDTVPLLWQGKHEDFEADDWLDLKYHPLYPQAIPLSAKSPCDEGVVVRAEGIIPSAWKAKSPAFLVHETKAMDTGDADLESQEG